MGYIVKEEDHYIMFDRFVRDMEIVTICEPVCAVEMATVFTTEALANTCIKNAEDAMFAVGVDINKLTVKDKDTELKELEEAAKERLRQEKIKAWGNTPEETRTKILEKMLKEKGAQAVQDFLKEVEDSSSSVPTSTTSAPATASLMTEDEDEDEEMIEEEDNDCDDDEDEDEYPCDEALKEVQAFLKDNPQINPDETWLVYGWMDWSGGEPFIEKVDMTALKSYVATGGAKDKDDVYAIIETTTEASDGGIRSAKLYTETEAKELLELFNNALDPAVCGMREFLIGENDNQAKSISDYIEELKEAIANGW